MTEAYHQAECQYIGSSDYNQLKPTCCSASVKNRSYCAEHIWLVYQEGSAVRRKKDTRRSNNLFEIISELNEVYQELLAEGEVDEA